MDIKAGKPYPAGALSNFTPRPFTIDGVQCNSMEGFLQSLKFKDPNIQEHICSLTGLAAKRAGANKNWQKTQTLYWRGKAIKRDSDEYQQLLDKAYLALYSQNEKAQKALLATQNATLTHSIGRRKISETVLTVKEFCSRLTEIRRYLQTKDFLDE